MTRSVNHTNVFQEERLDYTTLRHACLCQISVNSQHVNDVLHLLVSRQLQRGPAVYTSIGEQRLSLVN
ncbi:hypothetical protein J6590_027941 [Homalodisca vitripennis]|nr:hypothetical protein J6590_027941 [Homalodisca vitripennis]